MNRKLVVCGRATWDDWQDAPKSHHEVNFGGPGANIAVHLSSLGFDITLITAFGSDAFSDLYKEYLTSRGLNISYARTFSGNLPRVKMWLKRPGVFYYCENDGFDELEKIDLSELGNMDCPIIFADFPLSRIHTELGKRTLYSAAHISLTTRRTAAENLCRRQWRSIFLNREEADFLGGNDAVCEFSDIFHNTWLVTQGNAPTICFHRGSCEYFCVPRTPCYNPIGGGDAFAAGVIAGMEWKEGIKNSIKIGHAAASIIVSELGCQSNKLTPSYVKELAEQA